MLMWLTISSLTLGLSSDILTAFSGTPGCAPPATAARTVVDGLPLYDGYGIKDAIFETGSAPRTFIAYFDREAPDRSRYLVEILGRKVLVEARHTAAVATKTQGQEFAPIRDVEHEVVDSHLACYRHQALFNRLLKMFVCLFLGDQAAEPAAYIQHAFSHEQAADLRGVMLAVVSLSAAADIHDHAV